MTAFRDKALTSIPLLFLTILFWGPTLFDGKSIIHGDSVVLGLPALSLQVHNIRHPLRLLWADGAYGGHPFFAEGQGAFASPFNMVVAWVIAPIFGEIAAMNIGHWLLMFIGGIGIVGLCRSLGISRTAAAFAAIAAVFSPIWIGAAQNMTICGALAWVPWALWAMEEWLKRASLRTAMLLGAPVAMIVLSGYPQALHGAVIYMALSLIPALFDGGIRRAWMAEWRVRIGTGLAAILTAAGLSAIQWLPLLELIGVSHRSGGIAVYFQLPFIGYLRGLFLTAQQIGGSSHFFPGAGSALVMVLGALAFAVRTPSRAKGHMLAAFGLLQFGVGTASPLFKLAYNHDLVPGLHYFRTVHLYINIAVVGFAVMAAFAIDGLRMLPKPAPGFLGKAGRADAMRLAGGAGVLLLGLVGAAFLRLPGIGWTNFAVLAAAIAIGGAAGLTGRTLFLPALMLVFLIVETLDLRAQSYRFYDRSVLAKPASASAILAAPGYGEKIADISTAGAYGFIDSRDPRLVSQARRLLELNLASTNMLWGVRSLDAALALPMKRREMARERILDEIMGRVDGPVGARLMDLLAIRFISADNAANSSGLRPFWSDPDLAVYILENPAARRRFQLYAHHLTVQSPEEALDAIERLKAPALVIENPPGKLQPEQPDGGPQDVDSPGSFEILEANPIDYRADVTTERPAWFFVADANYPGWSATLDGKPAPLFTAQLLGKAVAIPPGRHRLEIAFTSSTFIVGLSISGISIVLAMAGLRGGARQRPPPPTASPATINATPSQ